jgi:DNA-directed RNA polymerase subunit RPC12/RpoP
MNFFTSETSFTCNECGKLFELKGHWYNQIGLETYNDLRYCWHKLIKHPRKLNKSEWKYIIRLHLALFPILVLEVLNIIFIPIRKLIG